MRQELLFRGSNLAQVQNFGSTRFHSSRPCKPFTSPVFAITGRLNLFAKCCMLFSFAPELHPAITTVAFSASFALITST